MIPFARSLPRRFTLNGRSRRNLLCFAFLFSLVGITLSAQTAQAFTPGTFTGSLPDGATYKIEIPANWHGTLLLYSHGYVTPGSPNPARDVGDPLTGQYLLANGYALAGSSYATTGWALKEAFVDQIALLDLFPSLAGGAPTRTIAWGHSLGGIITAGLIQKHPNRFDAALPMCGVLAGGVGTWNVALDGAFAFKTLLDTAATLQVVNITNPNNLVQAETILGAAQATAQGRARFALVAAFADTPGWFDSASPEPAAGDYAAREFNQYLWASQVDFPFSFALRAELEARAHGNPSWNTGVNYRTQLSHSINQDEVEALYAQAGLSLDDDLAALDNAARIAADPGAVAYLTQNIVFDGQLPVPVLTLHTTGDGLVGVQQEQAYEKAVRPSGDRSMLREVFVHRAGHCAFTPAETLAAFQRLIGRLDSGRWGNNDAAQLNLEATAFGSLFNIAPAAYIPYQPAKFLRPYNN